MMMQQKWLKWAGPAALLVFGMAVGWYINQPPPPWIVFSEIKATYEEGSTVVKVSGEYTARKTCSRVEERTPTSAPDPLIWRQEVQGTGPEIVILAPRPEAPDLKIGTHTFVQEIPLEEGISPDGWQVAVIASCGSEPFAIRSQSVDVVFTPRRVAGDDDA